MLKNFGINAIIVVVSFSGLLPLKVKEKEFAISHLFPVFSGR